MRNHFVSSHSECLCLFTEMLDRFINNYTEHCFYLKGCLCCHFYKMNETVDGNVEQRVKKLNRGKSVTFSTVSTIFLYDHFIIQSVDQKSKSENCQILLLVKICHP